MATKKTTPAATKKTTTAKASTSKAKKGTPVLNSAPPETNGAHQKAPSHAEIAERAYFLWEERGRHHGNPEHDWERAKAAVSK